MSVLENITRDNADLNPDVHEQLKALNSDRSLDIENAMMTLATVVRGLTEYVERTGDTEAKHALAEVIGQLLERSKKPVQVTVEPKPKIR